MENTTRKFDLNIQVRPFDDPNGKILAFASVEIEGIVAIRGIQVKNSKKGPFVSMPQKRNKATGSFYDIACPTNGDLRKQITQDVLLECSKVVKLGLEHKQDLSSRLAEAAEKVTAQKPDPAKVVGAPNRNQDELGA